MAASAFLVSMLSPTVPTVRPARSVAALGQQERPSSIAGVERTSVGSFAKIACLSAVASVARRASRRYKRSVEKHGPWWRPVELTSPDDFVRIGCPMETTWKLPSNAQTVHLPYGAPPRPSTHKVTWSTHRPSKKRFSLPLQPWPAAWVSAAALAAARATAPKTLPKPLTAVAHGSTARVGVAPASMAQNTSRVASDPKLVSFPVSIGSGANVRTPARHEAQKQLHQSASIRSSSNGASPRAIDELEIIGIRRMKESASRRVRV